jgi:protein-disulfide isomerase
MAKRQTKRLAPLLIIAAVLLGSLAIAGYWQRSGNRQSRVNAPPRQPQSNANVPLGAEPPHTLGSIDAPVMVEEFADFECPACASLQAVMKALKAEFGSRVVIVFRNYPVVSVHKHAMAAARAAEAAGLQGKFWEMHDLLYANQKTWHEAPDAIPMFEDYAGKIGLDLDRYRRDVDSEAVEKRITLDRQRASWIGVNGTPTVFLNGREVAMDSLTLENLRSLVNKQ